MSIFTCSGEIPFFAMQQEEFISGCPSSPVIYRVETHITGQMNLRLDQIDLRPLNAVISCFRMCVVKNIDMFSFDAASDVLNLHALRQRLLAMLEREGRMEMAEACFRFLPTRADLDLAGWGEEDIFAHS